MTVVKAASAEPKRRENKHTTAPVGKTFGSRTVISAETTRPRRDTLWLTRCKCGTEKWINAARLVAGRQVQCLACKQAPITCYLLTEAQHRAKKKGLPFDFTQLDLEQLMRKQRGLCAYTGEPLVLHKSARQRAKGNTLSLDRIDSSKGYVRGNVQLVHKVINMMKSSMSHIDFLKWCSRVTLR